ncbi:cytochrome c3 family protein [Geomesophilobacter sediminis]|uniref:Doubled CXXCH motif domain-containing protein n=1 Tax=Geomesophilobacter sediminis TaxID=2798584 RepID=A0A8J7SA87_9BACT|nr:cytochrome c3 family protein [Geomesophilobacter sediminis]MBJ6727330.1 hypothetical protein [Geomesophilobacter sediminis]
MSSFSQTAGAEFWAPQKKLEATGPCLFSEQLKGSEPARKSYVARVARALGKSQTAANSVEEMYNNIQPASYTVESNDTEPTTNIWGFSLKESSTTAKTSIDPLSQDCLGCHDGVGAVAVSAVLRNNPFDQKHGAFSGADHPIGMDYSRYTAVKRTEYKSVFAGTNRMIFVNGRVGCLTCHDPLNPEKGHLSMSDERSALCLTCHNK